MPTELQKEVAAKSNALTEIFDKAKTESGTYDFAKAGTTVEAVRKMNAELSDIAAKRAEEAEIEALAKSAQQMYDDLRKPLRGFEFPSGEHPKGGPEEPGTRPVKTIGEQFVESNSYKSYQPRAHGQLIAADVPGVGIKATFNTSGSGFTQYDRQPFVPIEQQKLTIADLFSRGETTMNTIRYPQEHSYTNAATAVSEGGLKPEATWDTAEADAPVRKIAVTSKITEELFADFPAMRDYINARMPFMVRQTEEAELLTGSGTAPHILGVLNVVGIQTQATSTDNNPDALYKAMTKVRTVGFFEPDAVVINPLNWTPIRLMKTTTGEYIWGHPAEVGPERIWGLLVDVTVNITANTALVGAFKLGGQIFYREGIRLEATNSNEDDFRRNLIAIRCEQRECLAVYRPLAFATVTGLSQ